MVLERFLYDLGKPEEKTTIEREENPLQDVMAAFDVWTASVIAIEKYPRHPVLFDDEKLDTLLEEAARVVPKKLPEKMPELHFPIKEYNHYLGLFYTALLNAGVAKISISSGIQPLVGCGYKLKQGILEIHSDVHEAGRLMTGGCIVNYASIRRDFGYDAMGGLLINTMGCETFGQHAKGGIFINCGRVAADMSGKHFGLFATGGIFIDYESIYPCEFTISCIGTPLHKILVRADDNTNLSKLFKRVFYSSTQEIDIQKAQEFTHDLEQELKILCTKL